MKHIHVILQINYNLTILRNGSFLPNEIEYMYVSTDLPCVHWRKIPDIQCSAITTPSPVCCYYIVS